MPREHTPNKGAVGIEEGAEVGVVGHVGYSQRKCRVVRAPPKES
jgi:hypothetical protein